MVFDVNVVFLAIIACGFELVGELSEASKVDATLGDNMIDNLLLHIHEILESDILLTCATLLFVFTVST